MRRRALLVLLAAAFTGSCGPSGPCDPAYPDVCIPPPPPDLDCHDISEHDFAVRSPDPHHFDQDHNGVGCEQEAPRRHRRR